MILIVSHRDDDHAARVLAALHPSQHPAALLDTAEFPVCMGIVQSFGGETASFVIMTEHGQVDLGSCGSAWWRRPQPFTLHAGLDPEVVSFAYTECMEAIAGLWHALDVTWVNPPGPDEAAHHKPYQLALASEIGLRIPQTLITNDVPSARAFTSRFGAGGTIYKTFFATAEMWRETRIMRDDEVALLDCVRLAPVIFQEYIPAVADIRVTVVGNDLFATAICAAPGGYDVDYRMDLAGARFEPATLPHDIEDRLRSLLARLGLIYGAIDLRRTADDEYVFLEINPAGEFLFVEERTGQPITQAMADLLVRLDDERMALRK